MTSANRGIPDGQVTEVRDDHANHLAKSDSGIGEDELPDAVRDVFAAAQRSPKALVEQRCVQNAGQGIDGEQYGFLEIYRCRGR